MPTHKAFKVRVRTRMTKTGESYTTAREQLLRKAPEAVPTADPAEVPTADTPATDAPATDTPAAEAPSGVAFPTSEASTVRATGKTYPEWFDVLDGWGAAGQPHTAIARWLRDDLGVDSWWSQSITVAYERARGLRAVHEMRTGFSVAVTRTIAVDDAAALAAFTDPGIRERWLPDAPMTQRPTKAARTARFDWATPPSRLVVTVARRDDGRTTVAISHERLPDATSAGEQKAAWRERLGALRRDLEDATD